MRAGKPGERAIKVITDQYRSCLKAGTCDDIGRDVGRKAGEVACRGNPLCVSLASKTGEKFALWFTDPRALINGHSPVYYAASLLFSGWLR